MKAHLEHFKEHVRKSDLILLALALLISAVGLVAIFSATRNVSGSTNPLKLMLVQGCSIVLGVAVFFAVSMIDLDRFGELWPLAWVLNIMLMVSLRFFGVGGEETGNNSWIRFAGIGIQPAELGKIIFIFTFARHIYSLRDKLNSARSLLLLLAHALITVGCVYIFSNDLGMCVVYILIFLIMLFASGLSMKIFLPLCAAGCACLVPLWMFVLKDYHKMRILVLFDPELSPRVAYNGIQSMIAVGGGKLFGYGYMKGPQTQYSILPSKWTDFIFSSFCEEWGFIGGIFVLLALSLLVWRIFYNASKAYDRFSFLMCIGIGGMLMVQILINVGMCLGIMPVIGITLPFMSYGGTSIVTMFASLGIVSGFKTRLRPNRLR